MSFDLFKYFGADMNNDTLTGILDKFGKKGVGNACVIFKGDSGEPLGMFLFLADTKAIPYVERALEEYDKDCEVIDHETSNS